ncbi:TetR/AcrR family transcriptional regulator [Gordonia soli]|uniref:Putative TetR family transcriptional regulator n=1 Tax=Gordonia soli NBRC 108243 TaxID=1223545 RepID=M0QMS1_9ACTN|nr:TetR/AcrR family transcriptional regulator [Gordonia soli]GAC69945.1 putative TetR family transcriptional regulator [Gordonia soli NBRC 108243]
MRSRQKIIDATLDLIGERGFGSVTIAAVADTAQVSRQTIYSNFGTREDLVSQSLGHFSVALLGELRTRLEEADSDLDYVIELIVAGRAAVREHAVLSVLLRSEDEANPIFDPDTISRASPFTADLLAPVFERRPDLHADRDAIVQFVVRIAMSVVFYDDVMVHTDADLRTFLARWLRPAIDPSR